MPVNIQISEASGQLKALFGDIQAPLASYITKRAETIEKEEAIGFKLFRKVNSTHFAEMYTDEGEMEDMKPVGEGGEYPVTGYAQGYEKLIQNVTYKNSFSVTEEAMDDDIITNLGKKPDKLLRSYYRGRARMMAAMIGNALQGNATFQRHGWTFETKCKDGGCVFHTAHAPKHYGSSQCNLFSDQFSEDALFAGISQMNNYKDDSGNTLDIVPDTIIIPSNKPSLKKAVIKVLGSMQEAGSGNNAINPLFGNLEIVTWGYLNDFLNGTDTPWILFDSKYNADNDGNIYQERKALTFRSELAHNDSNEWLARARYGLGFVDWRQMAAFGVSAGSAM